MDVYLTLVYSLHILAVAPILIYAGLVLMKERNEKERNEIENNNEHQEKVKQLSRVVFIIGLTALLYHALAMAVSLYTGSWIWNWDILLDILRLR